MLCVLFKNFTCFYISDFRMLDQINKKAFALRNNVSNESLKCSTTSYSNPGHFTNNGNVIWQQLCFIVSHCWSKKNSSLLSSL